MKTLRCRDVGFDCQAVIHADTEEEVLQQAARHAEHDHHIVVTPELAAQVRQHIHEEAPAHPA